MSFDRVAEYHNVLNTVSVNALRQYSHRSGDREGGGVEMLDYYACSPSPEEELIEREERREKRTAIKQALRVAMRYINTTFSEVEVAFIRLVVTTEDTPAKIAQSLNVDYFELSKTLYRTFSITSKFLVKAFYECGYYCRSDLDFLPRLAAYLAASEQNRRWLEENAERRKTSKREWYEKHGYKKMSEEERAAKLKETVEARRAAKLAALPPEKREAQRKKWERADKYYAKKKGAAV